MGAMRRLWRARRDGGTEPDHRILAERFWRGWQDLLPGVAAALGDREPQKFEHRLCQLVADLHPDLHFAVERGQRSIYALVVSGHEDPALRPYTDAWRSTAPPDDAIWEYHDSVPPVPDPTLVTVNVGAHRVCLADFRVAVHVDEPAGVVDVVVHHPAMAGLAPQTRSALTFLPLDATLGERVAGRRLRRVVAADTEPPGSLGLLEFRDLVHQVAERTP